MHFIGKATRRLCKALHGYRGCAGAPALLHKPASRRHAVTPLRQFLRIWVIIFSGCADFKGRIGPVALPALRAMLLPAMIDGTVVFAQGMST